MLCDQIKEFDLPTARDYSLVSIQEAEVDLKEKNTGKTHSSCIITINTAY